MAVYTDAEQLYTYVRALFALIAAKNPGAADAVLASRLVIRLHCTEPDAEITLNGRQRPLETIFGPTRIEAHTGYRAGSPTRYTPSCSASLGSEKRSPTACWRCAVLCGKQGPWPISFTRRRSSTSQVLPRAGVARAPRRVSRTMRSQHTVFNTERLIVRAATAQDVDLLYELWTDPQVMANVGFPHGLRTTREEIENRLREPSESEFERVLTVELEATGQAIGQCMMHAPDEEGVAETDIKLLGPTGDTSTAWKSSAGWWPTCSHTPAAQPSRQRPTWATSP